MIESRFCWVMGLLAFVVIVGMSVSGPSASAHDLSYSVATIQSERDDVLEVSINTHVPALLLGEPLAHLSDIALNGFLGRTDEEIIILCEKERTRFLAELYVSVNGEEVGISSINFPSPTLLRNDAGVRPNRPKPSQPLRFQILAKSTDTVELALPIRLGQVLLIQKRINDDDTSAHMVGPGQLSGSFTLDKPVSIFSTAKRFFGEGVRHVVPSGLDHTLFIISLAIVATNISLLIWQISGFTVAHTIALGLAVTGVITPPAVLIEPLIAASIAFVALLNLHRQLHLQWRLVMIVGLGFMHGFGFASALIELGLPAHREIVSLVAFNFGVEVGQLLVVLGFFAVIGWSMTKEWYRQRLVTPISLIIASVGIYWTLERTGVLSWV